MGINRRNWVSANILICGACLSIYFSAPCLADEIPWVCVRNCGGGGGGGSGGGGYSPTPSEPRGPSPEDLRRQAELERQAELRRQAEAKMLQEAEDLKETAIDANERGSTAYENGNYDEAVNALTEALDYAPDDLNIQHNLELAREALQRSQRRSARHGQVPANRNLAQSKETRNLKSAQFHGQVALERLEEPESAGAEARRVFDTGGENKGTLDIPAVNAGDGGYRDPVVQDSERTEEITRMESKREGLRQEIRRLEEKCKTLDPQKDAVQISKIRQDESNGVNVILMLNVGINAKSKQKGNASEKRMLDFSITKELLDKVPEPKSRPKEPIRE